MLCAVVSCVPTCAGADEFTSHTEQEEMRKIEKQLKNRFPVGSMVSEQRIVQDFLQQVDCVHVCSETLHTNKPCPATFILKTHVAW